MSTTTTEMMQRCFAALMSKVGTSIPGHVVAFDPVTQLAQIQPGIQRIERDGSAVNLPPAIEVPVCFPGGEFCIEYQIDPGTEGLLIVSQRCIDAWVNQGGVARPPIQRFHDMSDSLFIPGFRSQPGKLAGFENNGVRLRNGDGSQYIWLKNDGTAEITVTALNVVGAVNITGNTAVVGTMTNNGLDIGSTHRHGGVATGTGTSGVPVP